MIRALFKDGLIYLSRLVEFPQHLERDGLAEQRRLVSAVNRKRLIEAFQRFFWFLAVQVRNAEPDHCLDTGRIEGKRLIESAGGILPIARFFERQRQVELRAREARLQFQYLRKARGRFPVFLQIELDMGLGGMDLSRLFA